MGLYGDLVCFGFGLVVAVCRSDCGFALWVARLVGWWVVCRHCGFGVGFRLVFGLAWISGFVVIVLVLGWFACRLVVFWVGCLFDLVLLWFGVACLFLVVCGAGGVWVWIWIFLFVCGVLVEGVFGWLWVFADSGYCGASFVLLGVLTF